MKQKLTKKVKEKVETQPQKDLTRREFVKKTVVAGVAVGVTASVGPWFIKDARSSSGELKLFTWPDYSKPGR